MQLCAQFVKRLIVIGRRKFARASSSSCSMLCGERNEKRKARHDARCADCSLDLEASTGLQERYEVMQVAL